MVDRVSRRAVDIRPPADHVQRSVLPNGVRVLTDRVGEATSATFAVWVGVGGRDESAQSAGSSHFLEHLLFKGTPSRTALQIALEIDGVGGDMNAYTAAEHTAYFVKVPATESDLALDVLLDVVASPNLTAEDLDSEREVILSELASAEDDPEDLVGVRLFESLFPDHPLGRDVLGTHESIDGLSRADVAGFFENWYRPANIVVTGAGNVDHSVLLEAVESRLGSASPGTRPKRVKPQANLVEQVYEERSLEMVQLAFGWRGLSATDSERHALGILNHVLGTGPSSRLFQHVREEMGLTYAISSSVSQFTDCGVFSIHCATAPANAAEVIELIRGDVDRICTDGITNEELERTKRAMRGGLLMGMEDSGSRAARLGVSEILRGAVTPLDEQLRLIESVSVDDVLRVASRVLGGSWVLSAVGPAGVPL